MTKFYALILATLSLLLQACGGGSDSGATRSTPIGGASGTELAAEQILHWGNGSEPQTLDPHRQEGVPGSNIGRDLFEGLVSEAPNGDLIPGAAESWEISADGTIYTFKLRENARWSNGDPVTAADWVYGLRRSVDPVTGSRYTFILEPIKNAAPISAGQMPPEALGIRAIDPPQDKRSRLLYRIGTDGVVVINEKSRQRAILVNGFSSENVQVAEPGIDLERFSPRRKLSEKIGSFGLKKGDFVIGVVTRIRESRRLDIVLKALHALAPAHPQIQILLVGRGRKGAVESAVGKPAREMDIFDRIVMTGYCEGDRLVAAYRAMDVLVYPTPGSDKSCRTVREAMAAGTPVIAPGIGFLPELIEDHLSGRLMDFRWESLLKILKELIPDKIKLREMGRRSLETAIQRFSPNIPAEKTLAFYHKLLKII